MSHREGSEFYGNVAAEVGAGVGGVGGVGGAARQAVGAMCVPHQRGRRFDVVAGAQQHRDLATKTWLGRVRAQAVL